MSKAIKCDRCGSFYEENEKLTVNNEGRTTLSGITTVTANNRCYKYYDLCDECLDDLIEFLCNRQLAEEK